MTQPADSPSEATTDSNRNCIRCGYSVHGLAASGNCPECAEPVANSIRGDLLAFRSPEYVAALHRGVRLVIWSIVVLGIAAAGFLADMAASGLQLSGHVDRAIAVSVSLLMLTARGFFAFGWFLLSSPDPAYPDQTGITPRRVVRVTAALGAAVSLGSLVFELKDPGSAWHAEVVQPVNGLVWALQFLASMLYLRWLAPRLPDDRVFRRSKHLMWLGPALIAAGALLPVFPLIALGLYWSLLDRARQNLERCVAAQEYERSE